LSNRVGNTTLRLPSTPPLYGHQLTNAFGNLSFVNPTVIASPPGETNRIFVVEQAGRVAVITNLAAPTRSVFLNIADRVSGGGGGDEQGLLGMAFHPGYATNGLFFLYFTASATTTAGNGRHQILSRFQVAGDDPNTASPASEVALLTMFDEHSDHNGGDLHFGPDGYLYVSLGDEGGQGDSFNNSQRINKDFWSSMLRLDVDVPPRPASLMPNPHPANTNHPGRVVHYRIPPDNPFIGATSFNGLAVSPGSVRTEMFAVGFRNPWRFCIDSVTGSIYCGDVGGDTLEEISLITRGGNYGWAYREATNAGPKSAGTPLGFTSIPPLFTYRHGTATNQGNAVVAGVVYRGNRIAGLQGSFIFGDYVSGNVWALRHDGTSVTSFFRVADDPNIAAFGIDPSNGDVLTADQNNETIKRLIAVPNGGPTLPPTLAETGVFTNLPALTPHAGFVPYDVNVPFWSDNAIKTRWFYIPTNRMITFGATNNWLFPTGSVWVKHFQLELTNGVPSSRRRLETRVLVTYPGNSGSDVYGLTYRWGNSLTNALLVPDGGLDEAFVINDGGNLRTQIWHYPGRSECLLCHTRASQGGLALGFNTPQINRDFSYGGTIDNQLRAMSHAGYFSVPITNLHSLRALAHPANESASVEQRVRSWLAANCAQCHQPGGSGVGRFDARLFTRTGQRPAEPR
jgi:glucose/arabinose dehydrogenase